MSRKKKQQSAPVPVPQDLQEKVETLRLFAALYSCLQNGQFPGGQLNNLQNAFKLIGALHEGVMQECVNHPEADSHPEIKAEKERRAAHLAANSLGA